ncbi:1-deoxy-D-xylulose-5-phosphate reductoisomerase [Candidatus Binatus soli]|jgi:1-deoxy-D-xylulose-5-phosphate reductoisomerase|uniref:1-deoxy-D-xylulose-5-phosphate reductoisomerase n=1 Tax=Candidatus Binatus soli TaxID=1953413 RepID=UPI003D0F14C3
MKAISILGSTGSVGVTTLDVAARFSDRFRVVAMAAGRNLDLLTEQVKRFHPELVSVATPELARELAARVGAQRVTIVHGLEGAIAVATHPAAKLVMSALVGAMGLQPTLAAIKAGKDIAFANKEVLVIAGELITAAVRENRVRLLPVDSEHNAVFQCLEGRGRESLKRVILTASGGPFRELAADSFESITVEQALKHPTWRMGSKITIDSATLMNKGLEVIEARWLFDLKAAEVSVVIHPQSVIHSMVEMIDGSVIAEMAIPDMAIPVAYALAYPERLPMTHLKPLSLVENSLLTFEEPDLRRFPCLRLAYEALAAGHTMPACLNAANEELVAGFLAGRVRFMDIPRHIETVMQRHHNSAARTIEDLLETDGWARAAARELIGARPVAA